MSEPQIKRINRISQITEGRDLYRGVGVCCLNRSLGKNQRNLSNLSNLVNLRFRHPHAAHGQVISSFA